MQNQGPSAVVPRNAVPSNGLS